MTTDQEQPKLDLTTATDDEKFAWCCKVLYEEQGMTDSGKLAAGFLIGWVMGLREQDQRRALKPRKPFVPDSLIDDAQQEDDE